MTEYHVTGYLAGGCGHSTPVTRKRAAKMLRSAKAGPAYRWSDERGERKVREVAQTTISEFSGYTYNQVVLSIVRR